jgi:hypothetical protein
VAQHFEINADEESYEDFLSEEWLKPHVGKFDSAWFHVDRYVPGQSKLVCFDEFEPWETPDEPLAAPWKRELIVCMADRQITAGEIKASIERWHVRHGELHPVRALSPAFARFQEAAEVQYGRPRFKHRQHTISYRKPR